MAEHNRLLYVALTRAEDRLLVCGWQTRRPLPDACWYNLIARGIDRLAPTREAFADWSGTLQRVTAPQRTAPAGPEPASPIGLAPLPGWLSHAPDWRSTPPPPEPPRPERLAPSRPEGVELGSIPAAASPLADAARADRFQRGQLLHALLQHLPDLPEGARAAAARRWLDRPGHGLPDGAAAEMAAEAMAILHHSELAPLFGPSSRAEVPLTGVIGSQVVGGLVDRLAVLPEQVLMADFKTNRRAPERVADTPVMYLRQMAAYRAVLRRIFPDRPVRCALIWTRVARVAMLPDALLDPHEPSHAAAAD